MLTRIAGLSGRKWLLLLAVTAVLIRLPWAMAMSGRAPQFDEIAYVGQAERLCAGQGYVDSTGAPTDFWPVGYPAVLALAYCGFGVSMSAGVALQVLLLTLTILVISGIGESSFGRRIGRTGAFLLAVYPNYIFYSTLMLTEPLCALLLVSMAGLLLRITRDARGLVGYSVGTGILAGLAALVRPGFLFLPVLLPLWGRMQGLGWRKTMALTAIVTLASLMTLAPWMIRNYHVTGVKFEVASNGGLVFWGGNHPESLGGVVRPTTVKSDLHAGTPEYDSSLGYRLGLESIVSDFPATLRRTLQKMTYFLAIETDGAMWNFKGLKGAGKGILPVLLAGFAYFAAMAVALLALVHGLRNRAFGSWFLLLFAYSIAIAMVFEGDPRYHFPLIPFLLVYSAAGLTIELPALMKTYRRDFSGWAKDPKIVRWSVAMMAFLLIVGINLWLKVLEGRL
jgi:4-amino-4-deoxy-L-arabinose transferase-like glycosyltransferase